MKTSTQLVVVLLSLLALHRAAVAADKPSDLIVGKWRIRAADSDLNVGKWIMPQEPSDEFFEFRKDGTGTISKVTPKENHHAPISWKITRTYGNACLIYIKYVETKGKPLPKEAIPFNWLIAFDGKDTFVTQLRQNEIFLMERQQPAPKPKAADNTIPE